MARDAGFRILRVFGQVVADIARNLLLLDVCSVGEDDRVGHPHPLQLDSYYLVWVVCQGHC